MERLAGMDASFLYLETPRVHMNVGFGCVLAPHESVDVARVIRHLEERLSCHPVFRRRLARVPFDLHHPLWLDDPDFDVIHHLHRVTLPHPGGPRELGEMLGRISSSPLNRSRPLWEVWVIEGLEGGRLGVMLKVHHAVADGVSGASILLHLFDRSPTTIAPPAPLPEPERVPNELELITYALRSRLKEPWKFLGIAGESIRGGARVLKAEATKRLLRGTRPLAAPRTLFNQSVSAQRNLATSRYPLDHMKLVKTRLGCTLNDVILGVAAGGLRDYLRMHGELPERTLTAACPVSVRTKDQFSEFNNKVSVLWTALWTDVADPIERIRRIHRSTVNAKAEFQIMGAETVSKWAEFAGPRVFNLAVREYSRRHLADLHRPVHNLVISNVPGPREPLYLAGRKLEAVYPMGPVMEGAGLNLTVFSYENWVDFGFFVDKKLVPDVWKIAQATDRAFEEIYDLVQADPVPRAEV